MKTLKVKGTVGRSDLEGGYLTLAVGDETYKLEGDVGDARPGATVEVEGTVDGGMMGIGFGQKVLTAKRCKAV